MRFVNVLYGFVIFVLGAGIAEARTPVHSTRIDASRYVHLGGIKQYITIHGAHRTNPVLLLVHGGPGDVQSAFRAQYKPYEQYFVLVQWDQRGAGRTYGRYKDQTPNMTLNRIVADGIELTRYLERHLHKRKIWILGHSWGSVVGVGMAQKALGLYFGYIGTGQVGSWRRGVLYQRNYVLRRAREHGNHEAAHAIQSINKFDPTNVRDFLTVNRYLRNDLGVADKRWLSSIGALTRKSMTRQEAADAVAGMNFSGRVLWPAEIKTDLFRTAHEFRIPVYIIQGKDDLFAPTPIAVDYFDSINAPRKRLFIIPHAGHFALVTNRAQFLKILLEITRNQRRSVH